MYCNLPLEDYISERVPEWDFFLNKTSIKQLSLFEI